MKEYKIGTIIKGKVIRHEHYGFFVELNYDPYIGLVEIVHIFLEGNDKPRTPLIYPEVGKLCYFEVLGYNEITKDIRLRWNGGRSSSKERDSQQKLLKKD